MSKICHIITSLGSGGAEKNLIEFINYKPSKYKNIIICLKKNNFFLNKVNLNCKVYQLNFKYNFLFFKNLLKLIKILRNEKPTNIIAWMYHSIFLSIFLKFFIKSEIFWNIRHSSISLKHTRIKTILIIYFCAIFSRIVPKKIIYNSLNSQQIHQRKFYCKNKSILILNGYKKFKFIKKNNKKFIISLIGRNSYQKNHKILLKASLLFPKNLKYTILFIGKDIPLLKNIFQNDFNDKILKNVKFFDEQKNLLKFLKIIDLNILPSIYGESFPNVVAETMSYGIPNIVTNVGNSSLIVNNSSSVLKNKNSAKELSKKILRMHSCWQNKKRWNKIRLSAIEHIRQNYNMRNTFEGYVKILN